MPEGPEIKTDCDALQKFIGLTLDEVSIFKFNKKTSELENLQLPESISNIWCHGKKLFFDLGQQTIMFSYGMTGGIKYEESKSTKASFSFSNGTTLYFNDSRGFGGIKVLSPEEVNATLLTLGPDVLNNKIDLTTWIERFTLKKHLNKDVSVVMLDQSVVAGIGNYLRSEILYYAKVHPFKKVSQITEDEWEQIRYWSHHVIRVSYRSGGASIKDYSSPEGTLGVFDKVVYMNKYDPNGYTVIQTKDKNGRMVHWVPEVQI